MDQKNYCFVVSIKAQSGWLSMNRKERHDLMAHELKPLLERFGDQIIVRFFDSDAFSASYSDFVICETKDPLVYHHFWDCLKDTTPFAKGFFSIEDVRMGIENLQSIQD